MKLSDQVISLPLAKRLEKLGVKQEALFWWNEYDSSAGGSLWVIDDEKTSIGYEGYAAFTVAELGGILPSRIDYDRAQHPSYRLAMEKQETRWNVVYICADCMGKHFNCYGDTEAEARGLTLAYLIEQKLI